MDKRSYFLIVVVVLLMETSSADINISGCAELNVAGETYYLIADIINSGTSKCINITANNVILDCQGHLVDGVDSFNTYGIYLYRSSSTDTNITVKNCVVTDWDYGIYLSQANNNKIETFSKKVSSKT